MSKISPFLFDVVEYSFPAKAKFHNGTEYILEDSTQEALKQLKKPKLFMKAKATHSGVLINNRVYPGIHVRDSANYWLRDYGKPVLSEHPAISTPENPVPKEPKVLGRVSTAKYLQLVSDHDLIHDFENPQSRGADGSGFIQLGCGITDREAIEEIIDGRKVTVSMGAKQQKLVCSICAHEWIQNGACSHEFGQVYKVEDSDKKEKAGNYLAFGITGKLEYHHLAFTWRPADTKAQVESIELLDSLFSPEKEIGELLGFRLVDTESGAFLDMELTDQKMSENSNTSMDKVRTEPAANVRDIVLAEGKKENMMSQETTQTDAQPTTEVKPEDNKAEVKPEVADTDYWSQPDPVDGHTHGVLKLDEQLNGETTKAGKPPHTHQIKAGRILPYSPEGTEYTSRHPGTYYFDSEAQKFGVDLSETPDAKKETEPQNSKEDPESSADPGFDVENKNPDGVEKMSEAELEDHEELLQFYQDNPDVVAVDARLTTAARKKLSGSVFCGPARSFPVPDKCLTAETEIPLLDGSTAKIGDLPARLATGEEIWTYGFNLTTRSVVPAKVAKVWKTLENAQILKVTLDNGAIVRCTANHPFLLRDLTYRRADELKPGDSLMPLYRNLTHMRIGTAVYEQVMQPWYRFWELTHHMVSRENGLGPLRDTQVCHHKDENKRNNNPSNLAYMDRGEHLRHHNSAGRSRPFSEAEKNIRSEFMTARMKDIKDNPDKAEMHAQALSRGVRRYDWDRPDQPIGNGIYTLLDVIVLTKAGIPLTWIARCVGVNPATVGRWIKRSGQTIPARNNSPVYLATLRQFFKDTFRADIDEIHADLRTGMSYPKLQSKWHIDRYTLRVWFSKLGLESGRAEAMLKQAGLTAADLRTKWEAGQISKAAIKKQYGVTYDAVSKLLGKADELAPANHSVLSIERDGTADVFDIEVPATANFALEAGVFVHNSHARAALQRLAQGFPKGASAEVKARIMACVRRKAKNLGVQVGSDSVVDSLDPNTQSTVVRTLAAQVDRLESDTQKLKVDVRDAQAQRDQYKTQADELQEKLRVMLVDRIIDLEFATGRKNVKNYRAEGSLKTYKDELLKRELVSLTDTANDLQKELIETDTAGTHPSLAGKPVLEVNRLVVDTSTEKKEEQPQSNDKASYRDLVLSKLKTDKK